MIRIRNPQFNDYKNLPNEYQQVAYIESTGSECIDTGVSGNNDNLSFCIKYQLLSFKSYGGIFGNYNAEADNCWRLLQTNTDNDSYYTSINTAASSSTRIIIPKNVVNEIELNKEKIVINGTPTTITKKTKGNENTTNIAIFSQKVGAGSVMRLYDFKIYDNETLIRSFVPCYRKSDNKPGVYDIVNGMFYTNARTTGEFLLGNINVLKLPKEYQEVEYLESTGTQYIDTGVIPQANSRTKIKLEFTSSTQTQYAGFFGAQVDDSNTYGYTFSNVAGNAIKFKGSKNYMGGPTFAINVSYEIDCSINTFNINGTNYTNTDTWSKTMDESIYIFTRNSAGVAMSSTFTTGRLYYFMQYEGDALIRDYIPCYRKSDNIPGLYDLVNNVFYTNAGTGTFLVGADVNKEYVNIVPKTKEHKIISKYVGDKLIYGEPLFHNTFIAIGGERSYYSNSNNTWSVGPTTASSGGVLRGIAFGKGKLVAVGQLGEHYYSLDGDIWNKISDLTSNSLFSIAYGNDRFICVGQLGESFYSLDGENWTPMTGLNSSCSYYGVIYGEGRFICVGQDGKSYYSIDGNTWQSMSGLDEAYQYRGVTYGNDRFVTVGQDGKSYYSIDGETWIEMIGSNGTLLYAVTYGKDRFVSVGAGVSYYSTDGETWQAMSGLDGTCAGIDYGNGKFICAGAAGASYYSTDGETWQAMSGLDGNTYFGILYFRKKNPEYEQLVNYTMLYDYGDECADLTGGWTGGKYITNYSSAGTYTKYSTYMYCKSGGSNDLVSAGFYTTNKINMSNYSKAVFNISQLKPSYVAYIAADTVQVNAAWTQTVGKRFDTNENQYSAGLHSLDVSTLTSDLYVKFGCWAYASTIAVNLVFLVKPDDWQKLASIAGIAASSIDDILTNSITLLSNEAAVDFMIKQCTGDFMASAIQSTTFLTALNNSLYKTKIYANEHWNKFLAIVA